MALVDQLVVTPVGQTPPSLSDPEFAGLGLTKANDRKAFRKAIAELELVPGPTYTFGFWCVAQFVDAIGWRMPGGKVLPEVRFRDIGIYAGLHRAEGKDATRSIRTTGVGGLQLL